MNNGKICVSVCAESVPEAIAKILHAEKFADVIEVRFDCLSKHDFNISLDLLFSNFSSANISWVTRKPIILTYRPDDQGGRQRLNEEERLRFWDSDKVAKYWDVEEDIFVDVWSLLPFSFEHLIVSRHLFKGDSSNLDKIFDRLASLDADIMKIAVATDGITDAIPVWQLLNRAKSAGKNIIPIAMGEAGKWTRILGLAHGSYMTYTSLSKGQETADGQITAQDMIETYRVKELDLNTKVYGVIGDPVSESLSPYLHNPAFVEQDINAVFIPLQVKELDEFMRRMVKMETREVELNFGGFSVTMPHKQAIIKHLDAVDSIAEKIGAVNTVKIEDDKLIGYNTDAHGFITPLKERYGDLKGARVTVCGAGGAARACVYALKQENADVTVVARNNTSGKQMADEFDIRFEHLTSDYRPLTTDIVVNATPLGMKGPLDNESLFTADDLKGVKFVYDLVTMPTDTPLICEAKKANIPAIGGLEMLIHQGVKQFEIWTGQTSPIEKMKEAVLTKIHQTQK